VTKIRAADATIAYKRDLPQGHVPPEPKILSGAAISR
jgi:hypothetical protein